MIKIEVCKTFDAGEQIDAVVAPIMVGNWKTVGWYEVTDLFIQKHVGLRYHAMALKLLYEREMSSGDILVTSIEHTIANIDEVFEHVIFVSFDEDFLRPIILTKALIKAQSEGFETVLVPIGQHWLAPTAEDSLRILEMGLTVAMNEGVDVNVIFVDCEKSNWLDSLILRWDDLT